MYPIPRPQQAMDVHSSSERTAASFADAGIAGAWSSAAGFAYTLRRNASS